VHVAMPCAMGTEEFQQKGILKNLVTRNADIIAYRLHVLSVIGHLLQKFYRFVACSAMRMKSNVQFLFGIKWYRQNTMWMTCAMKIRYIYLTISRNGKREKSLPFFLLFPMIHLTPPISASWRVYEKWYPAAWFTMESIVEIQRLFE